MLLPPVLISCVRTVPSPAVNSTMTRHFIPFLRPAAYGLAPTPQVWDGLRAAFGTNEHGKQRAMLLLGVSRMRHDVSF